VDYKKVDPKCLNGKSSPAYTAKGYLLPCCWCDQPNVEPMLELQGFFEDELKVENVDRIEDIIISDQWVSFYRDLDSFPLCLHRCSKNEIIKE